MPIHTRPTAFKAGWQAFRARGLGALPHALIFALALGVVGLLAAALAFALEVHESFLALLLPQLPNTGTPAAIFRAACS